MTPQLLPPPSDWVPKGYNLHPEKKYKATIARVEQCVDPVTGQNGVHIAAALNKDASLNYLVSTWSAAVDTEDFSGSTPLYLAAMNNS